MVEAADSQVAVVVRAPGADGDGAPPARNRFLEPPGPGGEVRRTDQRGFPVRLAGQGLPEGVQPLREPAELAQGSDPNLVTPTITGFSPPNLTVDDPSGTITINGTNFDEPGLAVSFGGQTPTPTNVTPTSFQVVVGPLAGGLAPVVPVVLGSGAVVWW